MKNETRLKPPKPLTEDEQSAIAEALGKKGRWVETEGVYTVPLPRNDLKVTIKGEPVPISFGFGGWASFKRTRDGKNVLVMSDTVLLPDEVATVQDAALANRLDISAVHNHFFYEEPRIIYMHVHGMASNIQDLARRYSRAIQPTKLHPTNQAPASPPNPNAKTAESLFDLAVLDSIVGTKGTVNGPSYKYTIGRTDLSISAMNTEMTAAIGLNSWAAFAGSMSNTHIAGDIALLETEVAPVTRVLRQNNLEIVALHHHLIGEDPRIIFLHYYGKGEAATLATGFKAALAELGKYGRKFSTTMRM
jgi:hypothetical protein